MNTLASWFDNDVFAGVMFFFVYLALMALFLWAANTGQWAWKKRQARYYDGGCIHQPHTCAQCEIIRWEMEDQ